MIAYGLKDDILGQNQKQSQNNDQDQNREQKQQMMPSAALAQMADWRRPNPRLVEV
jgi:hypothetical protein